MMEGVPVVQLPKAVLHDHLDGGLRIGTLLELAYDAGYHDLPAHSPVELEAALYQGTSGSLEVYLDSFRHTVAVMQTAPAVERVAYECGLDHAGAGVVYAEIRMAPSLLTQGDLTSEQVIEAMLRGFERAQAEAGIQMYLIVSAMRNMTDSRDVAVAAARYIDAGVVGFDLAGPERGNPLELHLAAVNYARDHGLNITLHAGEAGGPDSLLSAVETCSAQRLGHGVRIIEDCQVADGEITDLGPIASRIHDDHVPLEVCITSNIHTGIAEDAADHPFGILYRAGFNVLINTDNRLFSAVDMTSEFELAARTYGLNVTDFEVITRRTVEAGFGDPAERARLIQELPASYAAFS